MSEHLKHILDNLPTTPGVYQHLDGRGHVLYVGKAKNLRSRVRSYFQPSAEHPPRLASMVSQVRDIRLIQTGTEAEALILEANLIKKLRPRYNILYKDDKSYPFFKLTTGEAFPRLFLTRENFDRDAEYFGPYISVRDARETLNTVRRHFRLRTSKMKLDGSRVYRPCINFQLGRCLAPCRGTVTREEYGVQVEKVRMFLQGRDRELIDGLEREMAEHSAALRYEEAARVRDAIAAVRRTLEKQQVLVPDTRADQDVFALARQAHFAGAGVLFIRHGRLIGSDFLLLQRTEGMDDAEILRSVLARLYSRPAAVFPREVLLPLPVEDMDVLEDFLSREKGSRVRVHVVQKGEKKRLLELAGRNARHSLAERLTRVVDDETVLEEVRRELKLARLPRRVEAFDISNIQGTDTVASMVVFEDNRPAKEDYRKYAIRSAGERTPRPDVSAGGLSAGLAAGQAAGRGAGYGGGPDDFLAMYEVLTRRYRRTAGGEHPLPDLILIDGGKGQLNIAIQVLGELGISLGDVDLVSLAKGRTEKRSGGRSGVAPEVDYEYVVKPHRKNELRLRSNSTALHFLQRVRDESHRFAVKYHRELRRRRNLRTGLLELEGVGPTRAKALLRHFGSLRRVRSASLAELLQVPGLPRKAAESIHAALGGGQ
ncbi:MAG: excinuclease ABC subunit UvrC [Deltaproteobacteria bacterium]|nr:excinuclease ABC subunit UvrC [Deltaproteobacteria bacterium]